jgi:membrane-associated phospholipid phosphatase
MNDSGVRKEIEGLLRKTIFSAVIASVAYLVLFIYFDRTIDLWIHNNFSNTWLPHVGSYISYLADGSFVRLGIAFCFILVLISDYRLKKRRSKVLLYICICVAISIIIGDGLKYLLGRHRPVMLFDHNLYGLHFFSSEWALNSSPSGHTIRAFSLLTALSMLYRRFTVVFILIALLIGASRVAVTAHYPSDVLFGAFIGIFTAVWTYQYFFTKDNDFNK